MSHDGSILDLHTVEFKRLLPGPIELAWDYLTKPELLKTWFAEVTLEPRVGGAVTVAFGKGSCGTAGVHGTIREFQRPHVLSFSWIQRRPHADGTRDVDEGEVRFELAQKGDKVLLTLLHSRVPTKELASYGSGWHAYLDSLESHISARGPVDVMALHQRRHPSYDEKVAALQHKGAA